MNESALFDCMEPVIQKKVTIIQRRTDPEFKKLGMKFKLPKNIKIIGTKGMFMLIQLNLRLVIYYILTFMNRINFILN